MVKMPEEDGQLLESVYNDYGIAKGIFRGQSSSNDRREGVTSYLYQLNRGHLTHC